jgi:hypothetical protein
MKMATIEISTGAQYTGEPLGTSLLLRRPLFAAIRWGAVLAGVVVGLSVQLVLTLLGIASGLSALDVAQGTQSSMTGPLLWGGLSMLISTFIGGYVAARMSGLKRMADGVMHGAVSWAVATILFAVMATSVSGALLSGIFSSAGYSMARSGMSDVGNAALTAMLKEQVGNSIDAGTLQRLQRDISNGMRNDAIQLLVSSANFERERAELIVDRALIMSGSPEQASPQGRAAASSVVETAGATAWIVFLAVALSLAASIGGGVLGAAGARRITWSTSSESGSESTPP